jgi:acyl-CoA dehydrogenase
MPSKPPIPFSEPPYLCGLPSPYYTSSHLKWQKACRAFVEEHLLPYAMDWEREGTVPPHVFQTFSKHNMLIPNLPAPLPVHWLKNLGIHSILNTVKVEEWDYLHTGIYIDEMARSGIAGPSGSLTVGMAFGVPPLIKFGSKSLQERFLPDLLTGRKRTCIAITEPGAGSDVANISTTATKSSDGKSYILSGTKKWITNAIWSDHACMAVRTGAPSSGATGLSLLMVPLQKTPGVTLRRLKPSGQIAAGTTFITLDEVVVPIENLIGHEGMGMKYIMTNFNHERLTIAVGVTRQARVALSSAFEYCLEREAFGKSLMDQPVVRHRLAKAGAELESMSAWVEQFLYQMVHLPPKTADERLGGLTALAKAKAGLVINECAQCAVLLFGGNGYTTTGRGEIAERIYREVMGIRIPGGSEDVMLDLAVRQLVKNYQRGLKEMEQGVVGRPRRDAKL